MILYVKNRHSLASKSKARSKSKPSSSSPPQTRNVIDDRIAAQLVKVNERVDSQLSELSANF